MPTQAGRIGTVLGRWVALVLRFPKTVVVLGLVLAVLGLQYAAGTLGINTDTANMISAELPWRQDFIRYRDTFPIRDRNLVVLVDAPTPRRADAFSAALAERLRQAPERYQAVFLAGEGAFFERNGLLYLSVAELEALADRLVAAQPLLGLVQTRFDGAGIVEVVGRTVRADDEAAAGGETLARLYEEVAQALNAAAAGERDDVAWERLLAAGGDDSTRRMILLQPELDFSRVRPAAEAIEGIRAHIASLEAELDGDVTVRLTGTVAMEHEELDSVVRGASLAGILALVLVAAVLFWSLRSFRLLVVSVTTLLVGLCGTAAFAAAAVGHLNLLSVAFAVLYVGLGVDFILHFCLRVDELRRAGHDLATSLVESARGVGGSLAICAVTTAAGFYSFIPTPFDGVSELGLISGTGMFVSLIVSLTFLPAMLAVFAPPRPGAARPASFARGGRLAAAVTAHPRVVAAACAAAALVSFLGWPGVEFDSNPIHLRDPDAESIRAIEELAAESEAPLLNAVALAEDARTAARWAEALEALPLVREVRTLDSLVPDEQSDKQFVLEDIALLLGPGFADLDARPVDDAALLAELEGLAASLEAAAPLSPAESALAEALAGFLERDRRAGALGTLDAALRSDLPVQLSELETALGAEPFGRADLPSELSARWTGVRDEQLIEIVPRENVNDNDAAERFVDAVRRVVPSATGLPVVHREASATVVRSFRQALTYALAMVGVLLFVFLRRPGDVLLVIVPIVVAAAATAGLTGLAGLPFNFANIIALPLLVGVGVDNGIHMVHRMRTEPPRNGAALGTSTSRAVLASGLTTIASFGNLAFSPHVGMASMGKLLTLGMVVTMVTTLLLLPALLTWRGRP